MKAIVSYASDGTITSLAIGDGLLDAGENFSVEVDLPDDFPDLYGENAEENVARAVASLVVKPGTATVERRPSP